MDKGSVTRETIEELRKDAQELTKIAIEDNISKTQVLNMFHPIKYGLFNHWEMGKIIEDVKEYSDEQLVVSEIVGRTIISTRYKEKILFIVPKYYRRPKDLDLLARSITILYDDQKLTR